MEFSSVRDKHVGEICYIIGKGPSLLEIKSLEAGPIIAINESIQHIESLGLPNPVYSLQQDGKPQCMVRPKGSTLLLSQQSDSYFLDYEPRIVYSQTKDLGIQDKIISAVSAIEFARLFGCKEIVFLAFDAITKGDSDYYDNSLYVDPGNNLSRFLRFGDIIRLSLKGIPATLGRPVRSASYTAITLTGDRHLPFKLCRKWMLRQTILPSQWIVIDDGKRPLKWSQYAGAEYHYRSPKRTDPDHTIKQNMLEALKYIKHDNILIFEDDDWYSPNYCETILGMLKGNELVGQRGAYYYYWPQSKILDLDSEKHCALFKTAFKKTVIPLIEEICLTTKGPLIDIPLWKRHVDGRLLAHRHPPIAVGMKGLVGRPGTTSGWRSTRRGYTTDVNKEKLKALIGDDVSIYEETFPATTSKAQTHAPKTQIAYEKDEDDRYSWLYKDGPYKKKNISAPRVSKFVAWAERITDLEKQNIIDLGCGLGELANLLPHKTYTGVDVSTFAIEQNNSKNKDHNIRFIRHSIDRLPFEDSSFDLSICCDVLEHIPENRVDRVLRELFRVSSAAMLTIDCAAAKLRDKKGKNLHCTIKSLGWWKAKISKLAIIRYEDYQDKKVTFYCGSGYKSQGAFPEKVFGVRLRRNQDGSVWLCRSNPKVEKYMDKYFQRDGSQLRWHYPIAAPESIVNLKDKYKDKTCYIIGKGPSLDNLDAVNFEKDCPVLALNQSVHQAERCGVENLFVVQQDTGINCRPTYATPLLHFYIKNLYPEIPNRYIFTDKDFGLKKHGLTVIVAIAAAKYMGCNKLVLIAFDACMNKTTSYAKCIGHEPVRTSSGGQERFLTHRKRIEDQSVGMELIWLE